MAFGKAAKKKRLVCHGKQTDPDLKTGNRMSAETTRGNIVMTSSVMLAGLEKGIPYSLGFQYGICLCMMVRCS